MHKTRFVRFTLTTLSALTLIPLTYSFITRQDAEVTEADGYSTPAVHRHTSSGHSCSHCAEPVPAGRKAARARKIAAAGLLWEKSSADPASAASSMRIVNGMPLAEEYQVGSRQRLTLEDSSELVFDVKSHYVHSDGTVAVDATLPGTPEGTLHIQWNEHDDFFLGQIEYPQHPVAYEITQNDSGKSIITRKSIDQLVCAEVDPTSQRVSYGLRAVNPEQAAEASSTESDSQTTEEAASLVPALNSYPSAEAVVYLDFDGEVVKGTSWGNNITAEPASNFNTWGITDIWKRVAVDMKPFNLNVTTEEAVYLNAHPSQRIRCIITPSNYWYSGSSSAGGVAKLSSFSWSGDTPCWVFPQNLSYSSKSVAEACSHEIGHTFGLSHDGIAGSSYYTGHGSGYTGWAPIMGNGYAKYLTQWSKGEYSGTTNTQDDLAIITSNTNGFGYRNDDHNNQNSGASPMLSDASDQVFHSGLIERRGDVDVFTFESGSGSISLNIAPPETQTNLDIEAKLYDDKGKLLATANPATLLDASISTTVDGGTYYLHVQATGYGTADTGYTDYASLGAYVINGQVAPASTPLPDLSPYEQTVADLTESDQSLESDPDGDGLNNLKEHVFGTDPAVANTAQRFTQIDPTGPSGADFLLDLPTDIPSDALYTIEATCDLSSNEWESIASRDTAGNWSGPATIAEENGPDGRQRFRITDNSEQTWTCRFMRVRFGIASNP